MRKDKVLKKETDFRYQFPSQIAALKRRMKMERDIEFNDLLQLKTIYAVTIDKRTVISKINGEQKEIIGRLSLDLEAE